MINVCNLNKIKERAREREMILILLWYQFHIFQTWFTIIE